MKKLALLSLLVCGSLAAGCGGTGGAEEAAVDPNAPVTYEVTADLIAAGQKTYTTNCAPCHGPGGKGDGPSAATLDPKPRDHTNREYMDTLEDLRIAQTVQQGGAAFGYPNMPSSPHIRGETMVELIAFVRSLSRGPDGVESVQVKPQ